VKSPRRGTTLVELLIVVAVIAILATIAVVNLLQAEERTKVTVAQNDMRMLANGLAAYHMDNNRFPPGARQESIDDYRRLFVPVALTPLTTPVAYMTTLMATDPFSGAQAIAPGSFRSFDTVLRHSYVYVYYPDFALFKRNSNLSRRGYGLTSLGPDLTDSYGVYRPFPAELPQEARDMGFRSVLDTIYDPTNGSRSAGDLTRFGGNLDTFPSG
jgi:prepilin-type N-terminal cleavage/methylation domain-containing protein